MTTEENKTVIIESAPRWTWMILVTICLTLIVTAGVKSCNDWRVVREETRAKQQAVADNIAVARMTLAPPVEALVLRYTCVTPPTPCSTYINYRAQVWGDGPSFWVKWSGVPKPVLYGRGEVEAPSGVEVGEAVFTADDPKRPVVIRVYEKTRK